MKRDCRRALILAPQSSAHIAPLLLIIVAAVAVATCAPSTSSAAATTSASGPLYQTSVVPITNRSSHPACQTWAFVTATTSQPGNGLRRWRRGITDVAVRAVQPGPGSSTDAGGGESGQGGGIAVHDDSWHLGNGGFAEGHLEDEERVAAKKAERNFFRERSLTVYDQMREASMLLLAQQQILAAEETREQSSKPRFVAAAGGSQAARIQAARDRHKKRQAVAGLSSESAAAPVPEKAKGGNAAVVAVPTGPGTLSGKSLGVGGLDDELEEIRRRVCVPLAAPADLLEDLGISPVRGLLLYGPPGCGKTLLARRLSSALTSRPPTVVSGPEILERFVGSSEANIRALFDFPPDVPGGSDTEQADALHVIVMDEFDSIGQRRGGGDDGGDRVRDSVVNQLLARMDGFQELDRPTLLVALTNRIDLLDAALLRPGRFEVQVQIPGPDRAGREAILRIHTKRMHEAGRIEPPPSDKTSSYTTAAVADSTNHGDGHDALVSSLAAATGGFTGADLAGLVRAAASYALERAVSGGSGGTAGCRVTAEDFDRGLSDVTRSKYSAERSVEGETGAGAGPGAEMVPTSTTAPNSKTARIEAVVAGDISNGVRKETVGGQNGAAKSTLAAAAAVAAARSEDDIGGSLSVTDLAAVQELLKQKAGQAEDEDDFLFDAAQIVAQRRRGGHGGGGGGGAKQEEAGAADGLGGVGGDTSGAENAAGRKPAVRKFENTGWFHSYE